MGGIVEERQRPGDVSQAARPHDSHAGRRVPDLGPGFPPLDALLPAPREKSLLAITGSKPGTFRTVAEQRLGRLRSELDYGNIEEIIAGGIHEFIDGFQTRLNLVGEAIYEAFFASRRRTTSQTQTQTQIQHRQRS